MHTRSIRNEILFGLLFVTLLLAGPITGVLLAGESPAPYLDFPPLTEKTVHPSFNWLTFTLVLIFILVTTWPFWKRMKGGNWKPRPEGKTFPGWGWFAFAGLILFWILAWNRFLWFEPFQRFTFFPIWFCFIGVLNALAVRLTGSSLMTRKPVYFTLLFPVSAAFWWAFEYLNRFVNNWYYTGIEELGSWHYFGEASLAFSTVLPAVMSIHYILFRIPVFTSNFNNFPPMPWLRSVRVWSLFGFLSIAGLVGIGWFPEFTYPMLWIAPGLLWVAVQKWKFYDNPLLKRAAIGDLSPVWTAAIAALICGFFWEMWNICSEAKWIYTIPGVERFYLFEMPILGYAGYLPFGVICALVSSSLHETLDHYLNRKKRYS